jgi:hypothetical protein
MKEATAWVHAKDVRVGDLVSGCSWPSGPKEVTEVKPDLKVFCGDHGELRPLGGDVFLLHHRPRPEGKTENDMLWLVEEALVRCVVARVENDGRSVGAYVTMRLDSDIESNLDHLHEAIKNYKLSQLENAKG